MLFSFDPYSENDLLKAHQIMMAGLMDENGKYRTGGAGIVNATAERYIIKEFKQIFAWLPVETLIKDN